MSRHAIFYFLTVVCVLMACMSCHQGTVFNQYESTSVRGWERNDTISFQTEAVPEAGSYVEEVGVRISGDYPFMAVSLIVEQTVLPSGKTYTDTLACELIDENGKATGGNGVNHYQYLFPLNTLQLQKGESVHVSIRHCMKREILPGILDIGLKVSKEGSKSSLSV